MFTGLVEELGSVVQVASQGSGIIFRVQADRVMDDIAVDDSINVNGVCQTVVEHDKNTFVVQAVEETLQKTTLGALKKGDPVNLERSVRVSDRLGGHLVQGHVDGVGHVRSVEDRQRSWLFTVEIPVELSRYTVPVGSIAIDGVSLTIARLDGSMVTTAIIPHTWQKTTVGFRTPGDPVNIEVDVIAKYVEKLVLPHRQRGGLTEEKLKEMGY